MTMTDKTRLELALEQRERSRTPAVIKVLIIILLLALIVIGKYSLDLKKELSSKQEIFEKEKAELIKKVKELEDK